MRGAYAAFVLSAVVPSLCASIARAPHEYRASGTIVATKWPYLAGSILSVRVNGFSPPYRLALLGEGSVHQNGTYAVDASASPATAMLIAGNGAGLAVRDVRIAAPPSPNEPMLAVASYDDGIVLHDARTFSVLGVLATGGTPSDVAIDGSGLLAATDTQGSAITVAGLSPWRVFRVDGVPLGDEIAIDQTTHSIFVTNRDINSGKGALTRVDAGGRVSSVVTGLTPEGLAVDSKRRLVYVANVNDGTIAVVGTRSMRVVRRFPAIARVFSLAISPDGQRLYAISNQSAGSPFAAPGSAVAIDLRRSPPRIVARSGELTFPLGAALDAAGNTLFVTDESRDVVDVLDARTLSAKHPPLATCRTPWKPALDSTRQRLYIPCARANRVDVFDTRTLRRAPGAPFTTGSYPLAVAVWPGRSTANPPRR